MTTSLNSLDIMRVAFQTYAQHARTVLTASLAINLGALTIGVMAMNGMGMGGVFVLGVLTGLATLLTLGAASIVMAGVWTDGEPPEPMDVVKAVLGRTGGLIGLWLVTIIGVFVFAMGLAIFSYGVVLIIPGLYFAVRWSLAIPALVIRGVGVGEAFRTSSELTKQAMGTTVLVLFLTLVFNWGAPYLLTKGFGGEMAPLETRLISSSFMTAFVLPVLGLAFAELYLRLASVAAPPSVATPAPTGPWVGVPQPVHGMPSAPAATGGYAGGFGAPAATAYAAAPPQPYAAPAAHGLGAPPQPYGAPAPQAYGAPAPHAYGAPAAPSPQPYGAPPAPAPQAYGAPAPSPQLYGAPAPSTPQAYGAPAPQPFSAPPGPGGPVPARREGSIGPPGT